MNLEQLTGFLYPFLAGLIAGLIVGGLIIRHLIITRSAWMSSAVKAYHKHFFCRLRKAQSRYQTTEKDFTAAINQLANIGLETKSALQNLEAAVEVVSPRQQSTRAERSPASPDFKEGPGDLEQEGERTPPDQSNQ